ncbi:MAG: VacJ family lipoprotein [Erythrobacter sp.]
MPNAALIALTSPLLLGEVPEAALKGPDAPHIEIEQVVAYAPSGAGANSGTAGASIGLISLQWSLASVQSQAGPQDEEAQEPETQDEGDPAETEEAAEEPERDADGNVIVVEGTYGPPRNDPVAAFNEESYRITQDLDETFVEPVAYAYRDGLPRPIRDGLGNVVKNLGEPNNALNFLLQGKIGKSVETLGRLLINSTLGLGGLIDIAEKPGIGLPYRRNGFANTMGFYGVGQGPYLYLPVTGATTARDVIGSGLDQLLLPTVVGEPFNRLEFTVPFYLISNLDARLEVDEELKAIDKTIDPYAARRDTYLWRRARDIALLKGEEPPPRPAILREIEEGVDYDLDEEVEEGSDAPEAATNGEPATPLSAVIITRPR